MSPTDHDHDHDDGHGGAAPQGTLQELFPALTRPKPSLPLEPLHARVLEVAEPSGRSLVLTCWRNPGGAASLHAGLRPRVEAALLAELCRPATELRELTQELRTLRLAVFDTIGGDVPAALRAFGLRGVPLDDVRASGGWREALAHLRGEAQQQGHVVPDEPVTAYEADILLPEGAAGVRVLALEHALRERLGDEVFGARPGALYAHLAQLGPQHLPLTAPLTPTCESLQRLEHELVSLRPGFIRYIPPAVFQALADFVAVIAAREFGRRVEWAPSEPDELGLTPPPMVRAHLDDAWVHIPLGAHLLRWCLMPLQPGEVVPPWPTGCWTSSGSAEERDRRVPLDPNDLIPDVRDGLTRVERVVLYCLHETQKEFPGRNVPTATLYGRVVEHVDLSVPQFQKILQRLTGRGV